MLSQLRAPDKLAKKKADYKNLTRLVAAQLASTRTRQRLTRRMFVFVAVALQRMFCSVSGSLKRDLWFCFRRQKSETLAETELNA